MNSVTFASSHLALFADGARAIFFFTEGSALLAVIGGIFLSLAVVMGGLWLVRRVQKKSTSSGRLFSSFLGYALCFAAAIPLFYIVFFGLLRQEAGEALLPVGRSLINLRESIGLKEVGVVEADEPWERGEPREEGYGIASVSAAVLGGLGLALIYRGRRSRQNPAPLDPSIDSGHKR
jgi:hypothetical protein